MVNYYEELGIDRSLGLDDINRQLDRVESVWRVRRVRAPEKAARMLDLASEAREVFASPSSRSEYDLALDAPRDEGASAGQEGPTYPQEFLDWRRKAEAYLEQGASDLALSALGRALSSLGGQDADAGFYLLASKVYCANGDTPSAMRYANEALLFAFDDYHVHAQKAAVYRRIMGDEREKGHPKESLEGCQQMRECLLDGAEVARLAGDGVGQANMLGSYAFSLYFDRIAADQGRAEEYAIRAAELGDSWGNAQRVLDDIEAKRHRKAQLSYAAADAASKRAVYQRDFEQAAKAFDALGDYRDAAARAEAVRAEWSRIEAVAEDIVRSYATSGARTAKTELDRLREREVQLQTEKASGPALLRQASEAQQTVADLERQLAQLQTRRNALGVFAFGERREADKEITSVEARLSATRSAAQQAQTQARAVRSASAIDADLEQCRQRIAAEEEAEHKRAATGVGAVRHTEADLNDPRVLAQIKRAHPKETFLLGILGIQEAWQFGRWGGEPIVWRTIARQRKKVLAITVQGIDCRRFNPSDAGNKWETSELKRWLEGEFERGAFSDAERRRMASHPFCLSVEEAQQYFKDNEDRKCKPSALAVKNGVHTYIGACRWWLRSPGGGSIRAAIVGIGGCVHSHGYNVIDDYYAVRPALWLTL